MTPAFLTATLCIAALPSWEFNDTTDLQRFVPNRFFEDVRVDAGTVQARATGWDPYFNCEGLNFKATPWQYVVLRIKADEPGVGELFWSGQTTGRYGGLSPSKRTQFHVKGGNTWQEIVLFPYWQGEGTIRKMRLDLYHGVTCSIDYLRVQTWVPEAMPELSSVTEWRSPSDLREWKRHAAALEYVSPPLDIDLQPWSWVALQVRSPVEGVGHLAWAARSSNGKRSAEFPIERGSIARWYNVDMRSNKAWNGKIAVLGIQLPRGATLETLALSKQPVGPALLRPTAFGLAEGLNRVGRPAALKLQVQNIGGAPSSAVDVILELPQEMALVGGKLVRTLKPLGVGERGVLVWNITGQQAGHWTVTVKGEREFLLNATLRIDPAVECPRTDYVPAPRAIETDVEVCAYYFPGFKPDEKWTPIRDTAPLRKPLLGWYDEGNPECVDWQIKWARENGISVFLVDWYWVAGRQQLTHWFDAYRKSRYRDQLKVAIMWANHNPPNTHTMDDWERVTREWLDHYFNLPAYYRVDGKPLVMIWDPRRLREDLVQEQLRKHPGSQVDSTELVRRALAHSRKLARDAGYDGVTFAAIQHGRSKSQCALLAAETYDVATTYHEWGKASELGPGALRMRWDDVVATAAEAWQQWDEVSGELDYWPVVDTGWDSRPWHGAKARVIAGRTPEKFAQLLRAAADYAREHSKSRIVLGPVNEWGEGSYIEPCAEFGFEMIQKVRDVFGQGDRNQWPINIGPSDVGLGPYDYKQP